MPGQSESEARRQRIRARAQARSTGRSDSIRNWTAMGVRGASALVPGGPWGALAGGVGEGIAQTIEPREDYNFAQMGTQAALGFVPFGRTASIGRGMAKGATMATGGALATQQAEAGLHVPTREDVGNLALPAAIGSVGGGFAGRIGAKPKVAEAPPAPTPAPPPPAPRTSQIRPTAEMEPSSIDAVRRSTLGEVRAFRQYPGEFTPERAQALADNLVNRLGTPEALTQAEEIYRAYPALRRSITQNLPSTRQAPPSIVSERVADTRTRETAPLSERSAGLAGSQASTVRQAGLSDVDAFPTRDTPGRTDFRPPSRAVGPAPAEVKLGAPRQPRQPKGRKGKVARTPLVPREPIGEKAPPKMSEADDFTTDRPFAKASTSDLEFLSKSGNKSAMKELEVRKGTASAVGELAKIGTKNVANASTKGSDTLAVVGPVGSAAVPEDEESEWDDYLRLGLGATGAAAIGRSAQSRFAGKTGFRSYLRDWGKKTPPDFDKPPKIEAVDEWTQKLYNQGRDPKQVDAAVRRAFQNGIDPSQFDNLEELNTAVMFKAEPRRNLLDVDDDPSWRGASQIGKAVKPAASRLLNDERGMVGANIGGRQASPRPLPRPLEEGNPNASAQLKRADQKSPGFLRTYQKWIGGRNASKIEGILKKREFSTLDSQGFEGIKQFQQGLRSGQFKDVQDYFDTKHQVIQAAGVKLGFKENYLPQLWEESPEVVQVAARALGLKPKFALESVLENYEKGIAIGLKPKFQTISDLVGWYEQTANKAIADRGFFNWIVDHNLIRPGSKVPRDGTWSPLNAEHFPVQKFKSKGKEYTQDLWAPKDVAGIINNYLEPPRGEVLNKVADFASIAKNFAMSAGVPGTAINAHGFNVLARNVMAKGLVRGGSEGLRFMVNPKSAFKELEGNLEKAPFFVQHGLKLTTEGFEFGESSAQTLTSRLDPEKHPWASKVTNPLVSGQEQLLKLHGKYFEKPLFQEVLPALKLKHVQEFYKELKTQGMSDEAAARSASEVTNNLYGGINWEAMGRSRELQNWMRTLILAPDWLETNYRLGKSLVTAIRNPKTPQARSMNKIARNLLGAYAAANVVNYATSGHPMWDNAPGHALDIQIGESGEKTRWFRPFGTAADFARLPMDTIHSAFKGDLGGASRIIKNRLSLPASAATNLVVGRDDFGKRIYGRDDFGRQIPVAKQAGSILGEVTDVGLPPYIKAPIDYTTGRAENVEQAFTGGTELPIRYSAKPQTRRRSRARSRSRDR